MVVILITVFLLGSTTEMVLNHFQIMTNVDEEEYMEEWFMEHSMPALVVRIDDVIEKYCVRENESASSDGQKAPSTVESKSDPAAVNTNHFGTASKYQESVRNRQVNSLYDFGNDYQGN
jgi:hypothetical protein